jgi:WD40 repeat protein
VSSNSIMVSQYRFDTRVWSDTGKFKANLEDSKYCTSCTTLGEKFLTLSGNTLRVWTSEFTEYKEYRYFEKVRCVAGMPDGLRFVVALGWNVNSQFQVQELDGIGKQCRVTDVEEPMLKANSIVPIDNETVVAFFEYSLVVFNIISGVVSEYFRLRLKHRLASISAAAVSGRHILTGSKVEHGVRVFNINSRRNARYLDDPGGPVETIATLKDQRHALVAVGPRSVLCTATTDRELCNKPTTDRELCKIVNGSKLRYFSHHASFVKTIVVLDDGLRFASGGDDNQVYVVAHGLCDMVPEAAQAYSPETLQPPALTLRFVDL